VVLHVERASLQSSLTCQRHTHTEVYTGTNSAIALISIVGSQTRPRLLKIQTSGCSLQGMNLKPRSLPNQTDVIIRAGDEAALHLVKLQLFPTFI